MTGLLPADAAYGLMLVKRPLLQTEGSLVQVLEEEDSLLLKAESGDGARKEMKRQKDGETERGRESESKRERQRRREKERKTHREKRERKERERKTGDIKKEREY